MPRTICVANQKGGVGKTTTAINLADGLAKAGLKTVLVDLDPQCNATSGLGHDPLERHPLLGDESCRPHMQNSATTGLFVLPGSRRSADIASLAQGDPHGADLFRRRLATDLDGFDAIMVDCPPSLGQLTEAALANSTEVLMPIQCEYFAMEGLTQMIQVIRRVMRGSNRTLEFGGILLTMFDHTLDLTHEVEYEVREFFGEIVYRTVIPRDVAVCESPSHGRSVLDYAPRSRGARAYTELCMEVLERD